MSELDTAVAKLREALQAANDDMRSKIGDTIIYSQVGQDGQSFGTTVAQALFWTDYRTKVLESKLDGLIGAVQALAVQAGGAAAEQAAKLDAILAQIAADAKNVEAPK